MLKWYKNLRMKKKMVYAFILTSIITLLMGVFAAVKMRSEETLFADLYINYGNAQGYIGDTATYYNKAKSDIKTLLIETDPNEQQKRKVRVDNDLASMDKSFAQYADTASIPEDVKNVNMMKDELTNFKSEIQAPIQLAMSGHQKEGYALFVSNVQTHTDEIDDLFAEIMAWNQKYGNQTLAELNRSGNIAVVILCFAVLLVVGLSIFIGLFIANMITKPVHKLTDEASKLALGDISSSVSSNAKDEIGELMNAFGKIIDTSREQVQAAQMIAKGNLNIDIAIKSEQDVLTKSFYTITKTLHEMVTEMSNMSDEHNRGEIDAFVQADKFEGVYGTMLHGLNEMVKGHIAVKKKAMGCVAAFAKGDFNAPLEKFPGKKAFINDNIEQLRKNLKDVSAEINTLIVASENGELDVRADAQKFQGDWVHLMSGLNEILSKTTDPMKEAVEVLEKLASGDLTTEIKGAYKGDHAKIKNSLNATIKEFNDVLSDIHYATEQQLEGTRLVSDGAQILAQGATEQAAAVQELSATITDISAQTHDNANTAEKANGIAASAKVSAVAGNEAMQDMLNSMKGISDASLDISNIIKVINDIAFQTNLLALNAAVEAARVGQFGKGFAVVAEEVRTLASRSQTAAKNISGLIEDTVSKIDGGTKIANTTAESLGKIVGDVEDIAKLIATVANASKQQEASINEINSGVDQISIVVQNNSATAEESASASEELSSQSEMLKKLVERFKIRKNRY